MKSSEFGSVRRILIIDDNPAIHADFRKILADESAEANELKQAAAGLLGGMATSRNHSRFELTSAYQGQEGLAKLQEALQFKRPFEMAFVDVRMPPGWDGIETITHLWRASPDLPVVICTAYSDYALEDIVEKLGVSDQYVILKKPFDSIEAVQLANAMTEKYRLLHRVQERTRRLLRSEESLRQAQTELERRVEERTQELAEAKARLQGVLDGATQVAIVATDPLGRITVFNTGAERIFGYSAEEMIGQHTPSFYHLESELAARSRELDAGVEAGQDGFEVLVHAARHGGHEEREWTCVRKDGSHLIVQQAITALHDEADAITGFLCVAKDITPEKEAERARLEMELHLRQLHKLEAIGQLAAGIAHEINTPTQYVGDNVRFVRDSFPGLQSVLDMHRELIGAAKGNDLSPALLARAEQGLNEHEVEYLSQNIPSALNQALEGLQRITRIVCSMKEFSHPGGKERCVANLNHAVESTVTVARNEWKYVAEVRLELDPQLPSVPCYLGEFNQAILNLIVNAAHAIADVVEHRPEYRGTITIRTRQVEDMAEIQISDTGTGIPVNVQPHIFEPFFTTKGVGKGTGQGLSLVYATIVKKHGGNVSFETAEGRGTTFTLRLPIHPPLDPARAALVA